MDMDYDLLGLPLWLGWLGSACNAGDLGSIPGLGRFPGEGKDCPLRCSALENSMDHYSPWGCRVGHD